MNFPSSTFGGDPSTATLARISTEFDAIARQMSTVSAEFAELRRIVAQPDEPARDVASAPQSAVQPPAAGLTPPTPTPVGDLDTTATLPETMVAAA